MTNLSNTEKSEHEPKKRGRKALPDGEKKQVVTIRISPNAQATLRAAAEKEGEDFQVWARKVLTEAAKRVLCITD